MNVIFPNHELMGFQNYKNDFHQCLIVVKVAYYVQQKVGKDGMWMDVLLDPYELDLQYSFFKMTMATNNELVLKEVLDKNLVI
jgi:hypothetical protein